MPVTLTAVPYPAGVTEAARNLLSNPTAGTSTSGWSVITGGGNTTGLVREERTDMVGNDGANLPTRARVGTSWSTTSTSPGGVSQSTATGTISPGDVVQGSAYVAASTNLRMLVRLVFRNSFGTIMDTRTGPAVTAGSSGTSGHSRIVMTAVAPGGSSYVTAEFRTENPVPAGTTIRVTAAMVTKVAVQIGDPARYFDGDTPDVAEVAARYDWAGTAHASQSIKWQRTPLTGARVITPELVTGYSATREASVTTQPVIDRPDPLINLAPLRTRTGVLEVWCRREAAAFDVLDLYANGRLVMLRDSDRPRLDMYHVATRAQLAPDTGTMRRWLVTVDYVETYQTGDLW